MSKEVKMMGRVEYWLFLHTPKLLARLFWTSRDCVRAKRRLSYEFWIPDLNPDEVYKVLLKLRAEKKE